MHIPGMENADFLSHWCPDPGVWFLDPEVFSALCHSSRHQMCTFWRPDSTSNFFRPGSDILGPSQLILGGISSTQSSPFLLQSYFLICPTELRWRVFWCFSSALEVLKHTHAPGRPSMDTPGSFRFFVPGAKHPPASWFLAS